MSIGTRRQFLTNVRNSLGGVALTSLLAGDGLLQGAAADPLAPKPTHFPAKAKSIIWVHMEGAASHVDLFDYKPELIRLAGQPLPASFSNFNSTTDGGVGPLMPPVAPFKQYGQSGHWISDLYPNIAQHADELAMLKSCTVLGTTHPVSLFHLNTGAITAGRPALGSWLLYGLGSQNENLPAFVVMTDDKEVLGGSANWASGFLPAVYQGTKFRRDGAPILHLERQETIGDGQQRSSLDYLRQANEHQLQHVVNNDELEARIASYELAYRMQTSAPEAVDLTKETEATKKLYGVDEKETQVFGSNCLLARRLVERGVRFVQLYCGSGSGWDAHENVTTNHGKWAKVSDKPVAALLTDLKARGLLDSTLVVWGTEFGRTPFSQNGKGRDHNPWGYTMWFAGGGSNAGAVVGATDELGMRAVENVMDPHDLHATIMRLAGLDHLKVTFPHNGRQERATVVYGHVVKEAIA
jgi:hypothetical protein